MVRRRLACVTGLFGVAAMLLAGGMAYAGPYDAAVMADSPFLYYRFEEGGGPTAIDTAGGDQNGTYLDGVTLGQPSVTPELGSSGLFAGTDDRIDLPALGSYSQHSIEMWINTNGLAGGCCTSLYHTDTWGTDGNGSSLHFNVKSGRDIEHAMPGGSPNNVNTPGGVIQDGNWYHVVATYDATAGGDVEIYINGVNQSVGGHSAARDLNLTTGGEIGTYNLSRDFKGNIDEVAMYASVLSEARVQAHYAAANIPAPPPPGMLSYWNFDSKAGAIIPDQVAGSTHDGTLVNNADITTGGQGFSGEALNANADGDGGTKGYMLAADSAAYNGFNGPFTWHARVRTQGGNDVGILANSPVSSNWDPGAKALFLRGNEVQWDTGWVGNPNTNWQLTDDQWHQLIVTFDPDGDAFQIFVDGVARFDGTHDTDGKPFNPNQVFHVGWGAPDFVSNEFSGLIDDVALFDMPLTGEDLDRLIELGPSAFLQQDVIPEPATLCLLGLGLAALARRRRKSH